MSFVYVLLVSKIARLLEGWTYTYSSGEPYFLMNSPWNFLSLSQTAPMSFSEGRNVVRKWKVPSTWKFMDVITNLKLQAAQSHWQEESLHRNTLRPFLSEKNCELIWPCLKRSITCRKPDPGTVTMPVLSSSSLQYRKSGALPIFSASCNTRLSPWLIKADAHNLIGDLKAMQAMKSTLCVPCLPLRRQLQCRL